MFNILTSMCLITTFTMKGNAYLLNNPLDKKVEQNLHSGYCYNIKEVRFYIIPQDMLLFFQKAVDCRP